MIKLILIILFSISYTAEYHALELDSYYKIHIKHKIMAHNINNIEYKADMILHYAKKWNHPPLLICNLVCIESKFNEKSYNEKSGAIGLCQILTNVHKNYRGGFDIEKNLDYGCKILRQYYIGMGNYRDALIIYSGYACKKYRHKIKQREKYLRGIL